MKKRTDTELEVLHNQVCEGIEQIHQQREIGDGGRARTLFTTWRCTWMRGASSMT
jgi:hypothetical protein